MRIMHYCYIVHDLKPINYTTACIDGLLYVQHIYTLRDQQLSVLHRGVPSSSTRTMTALCMYERCRMNECSTQSRDKALVVLHALSACMCTPDRQCQMHHSMVVHHNVTTYSNYCTVLNCRVYGYHPYVMMMTTHVG